MGSMFRSASAFNQLLSHDTSSVTNMGSMFASAVAFNQPLNLDTSSVKFIQDGTAAAGISGTIPSGERVAADAWTVCGALIEVYRLFCCDDREL